MCCNAAADGMLITQHHEEKYPILDDHQDQTKVDHTWDLREALLGHDLDPLLDLMYRLMEINHHVNRKSIFVDIKPFQHHHHIRLD
jgi:hypothetical protein